MGLLDKWWSTLISTDDSESGPGNSDYWWGSPTPEAEGAAVSPQSPRPGVAAPRMSDALKVPTRHEDEAPIAESAPEILSDSDQTRDTSQPSATEVSVAFQPRLRSPHARRGRVRVRPSCEWVPPGGSIRIGRFDLHGGMVYVGSGVPAVSGGVVEPALVDPHLNIDVRGVSRATYNLPFWPSYLDLSPAGRAGYLTWLADGRRDPIAADYWPLLFLCGLERRVLADAPHDLAAQLELPAIRAEVARISALYAPRNPNVWSACRTLLEVIEFVDACTRPHRPAPDLTERPWPAPMSVRAKLGALARDSQPLPADWAYVWALCHASISMRATWRRCPTEFASLFQGRYAARYRAGIRIRATKRVLETTYYALNTEIGSARLTSQLPDVFDQAIPVKKLAALVEDCTASLDVYSRFLANHPDARGTATAAGLLPNELTSKSDAAFESLTTFAEAALGDASVALVDARDLLTFWLEPDRDKLGNAESAILAGAFEKAGYGLEPDTRLGGPSLNVTKPAVLFRSGPDQPTGSSQAYAAATVVLHLAVAVCTASGAATAAATNHLARHVEQSQDLSPAERRRLHAHIRWLLSSPIKLTGLTHRLADLSEAQREVAGSLLAAVAAAHGHVPGQQVKVLERIFKMLRLNPDTLYSRLHAAGTAGAGPVTVRAAGREPGGYALPPRPTALVETAGTAEREAHVRPIRLNNAAIAAKLAETAAVSELLGSIFTDEDAPPSTPARPTPQPAPAHGAPPDSDTAQSTTPPPMWPPARNGIDDAHSQLLRRLAGQDVWSRADVNRLCAEIGLLPDGALDTLNEAAYQAVDEPLTDGHDPITIDQRVAQEMSA